MAVIPGDGIGPEVMAEGLKVLKTIEEIHGGLRFDCDSFDWNCEYYLKHGRMMPANGLDLLRAYDVILLGAIGAPTVPDHISLWELILPIRRTFQQYINLRPIKLLRGVESPLRHKTHEHLDFVVVRENTEGEYSDMGGRLHRGTPYESGGSEQCLYKGWSRESRKLCFFLGRKKKEESHRRDEVQRDQSYDAFLG